MNTAALDTMAFDKFEVADMDYLTSIEAGSFSWKGFNDAVGNGGLAGAATGATEGAMVGAMGGTAVCPGVGTITGAFACGVANGFIGAIVGGIGGGVNYLLNCWG